MSKRKPVPIIVRTFKLDTTGNWERESVKYIDHANTSDRKWLGSHCHWAMRNERKVETAPEL